MDSQEFFEHFIDPTLPLTITRDSLLTDKITRNQPNASILHYFENLASSSVVLYRAEIGCVFFVHERLDQLIQQDIVTLATMERLLALALHPDSLCHFDDKKLIPTYIKLLQNYISKNRVGQPCSTMLQFGSDNEPQTAS